MVCKPRLLKYDSPEEDPSDKPVDLKMFRILKEALLCPVCFDVYKDPLNVKQCLHKFCASCIEDYNRKVKKECPGCRH